MLSRLQVSLLLGITVVVWAVVLAARATPITWDHLVPFGVAVTVLTGLLHLFNTRCWRLGVFKGWLVQRPWIQGTWRVVLQRVDADAERQHEPIAGYMVFRQSFSSLTARLYTAESRSTSLVANVLASDDCVFQVSATYQNEPRPELRGVRSEIHFGAFLFDVHGDPPAEFTGKYWNDRRSLGTMVLSDRVDRLVTSFEEGERAYARPREPAFNQAVSAPPS